MYGISKKAWDYIIKNKQWTEVFKFNKDGQQMCIDRKKQVEARGYRCAVYIDKGVSVGFFVLPKKQLTLKLERRN